MSITLVELKQRLADEFDEVTLLEILDIKADEIVERFDDKIEAKFNKLVNDLDWEEWVDDDELL